ncbi:S8 family serine peptidase [Desulfobacter latus]|uniref:S8 family serine peptidase n=1 Tax=Desulfobacter latus TaxID=2292 RepID=A0A850TD89_9BACT|nr:S8 family serine peptidase [Desulfobacter latus]NWH06778.1 S8 family serine peptidase [Desulfobacter latus]
MLQKRLFSHLLIFGTLLLGMQLSASAQAPCKSPGITFTAGKLSFEAKAISLDCLMAGISRETGIPIRIWPGAPLKVTLSVDNMDLESVFRTLGAGTNALAYTRIPQTGEYRLVSAHITGKGPAQPGRKKPVPAPADAVPGELLVQFKDHVPPDSIQALHRFIGSRILRQIPGRNIFRIKIAAGMTREIAADMYLASGLVKAAEPNLIRRRQTMPDDPKIARQWGLSAIQAPAAWETTTGAADLIIALIDTGVDLSHSDLAENIWTNSAEANGLENVDDDGNGYVDDIHGWDMADNDNQPYDTNGHGTHIAGTIGAVTGNGTGIAGVCPRVRIMSLKVEPDNGSTMTLADIIEAVTYAQNMGAAIVNCSFGADFYSDIEFNAFKKLADTAGALIIASAGNENRDIDLDPLYPAAYEVPAIVSVASSSEIAPGEYGLSDFSNYGAANADLMAPGNDIYSTLPSSGVTTQAYFSIDGENTQYPAEGMTYSQRTDAQGITGILIDCGYGYPNEIPSSVKDNIALIKRGAFQGADFYFYEKVANAQAVGAAGAVIYNNVSGEFAGTLGTPGEWITTVSISLENGELLLSKLPVQVTLVNKTADPDAIYGSLSGTSMAAGFVSGAAGLVKAFAPQKTATEIKALLMNNTDVMPKPASKVLSSGHLNIFKTLASLTLPGDLNKDFKRGLNDAFIGLKLMSGQVTQDISEETSHWETQGDGRAGMSETLKALQAGSIAF